MGLKDLIAGRDHSRAHAAANLHVHNEPSANGKETGGDMTDTDSSNLSLEERNEKEVIQNGTTVTADAQLGIKKAEAAALVWTRKTVYLTYAW
jgi:hypothetical protein